MKKYLKIVISLILLISCSFAVKGMYSATTKTIVVDEVTGEYQIDEDLLVTGTLKGESPIKVEEGTEWVDSNGVALFDIYIATSSNPINHAPSSLDNALIIDTEAINNSNNMEIAFIDSSGTSSSPVLILNEGIAQRASTFNRSLQIGKDLATTTIGSNYTLCEGFSNVDCDSEGSGADLVVEDDIEAKGNIYASNFVGFTGTSTIVIDIRENGGDKIYVDQVDFRFENGLLISTSTISTKSIDVDT